jgi:hypothetical protein
MWFGKKLDAEQLCEPFEHLPPFGLQISRSHWPPQVVLHCSEV